MRASTLRTLPVVGLLAAVVACSEPTSVTREGPSAPLSERAIGSPDDYVPTPAGWYHRSCIHEIEEGAVVHQDGLVKRRNGLAYRIPRCGFPVRTSKNGPVQTPTINNWLEYAARTQPSGSWYRQINANWTVPVLPLAPYGSGQVYFTFPGLQSTFIIQPVIQYGVSAAGGGEFWAMASWHCHSSLGCTHSPLKGITAGHIMYGSVAASACSGANCTWTIISRDLTSNVQTVLNVTDTYNYWWGVGGSVEVYGINSCDQFPINGTFFNNIALYDQNSVLLSPSWTRTVQSTPVPSCSFSVTSGTSTVNLFHNPASVTANGGLTATCGQLICTDAAIYSIQASGNQITVRDVAGHSGIITLTGATATGGLTASCTGLFCTTAWIYSLQSSGNRITVRDIAGHTGTITFTGATVTGGLTANCGTTCTTPRIMAVTANGSNGLTLLDGGSPRSYIRFN